MTSLTQAYPLKLPQDTTLRHQLDLLRDLALQTAQQLLEALWSDHWIDVLDSTRTKKAYKVVNEKRVIVTSSNGRVVYLPSRIRRCIAEQVGRILRSQAIRKRCYYDVLRIVQLTGVEGNLDSLVRTVALTLANFEGKFYRWALIRQTLRMFRRYYYQLGLDLNLLMQFSYTAVVTPRIQSFTLPYSPDDGQAIRYDWQPEDTPTFISIRVKVPCRAQPSQRAHWAWREFTLLIPTKIQRRISSPNSKLCAPTLRYLTLKSGLTLPFLECVWSWDHTQTQPPPQPLRVNRVMATDLGVINLTTSVICEAGSQLGPPIFWSPSNTLLHKIEQLYHHIARLQRKLDRYPVHWCGQGKRRQELERLYRKLNRYRQEILHLASNHLLETALRWGCKTIVLEDLRNYEPPKHRRKLSRKLSNWLRGALYEILSYKAKRVGIKLVRVNPRWTSSYCPRCGAKGEKISDPRSRQVTKRGRFFYCGSCNYLADRDYIAAINIYRVYQELRNKRFSLKHSKPVPYMATGIPLNRPSGDSTPLLVGG